MYSEAVATTLFGFGCNREVRHSPRKVAPGRQVSTKASGLGELFVAPGRRGPPAADIHSTNITNSVISGPSAGAAWNRSVLEFELPLTQLCASSGTVREQVSQSTLIQIVPHGVAHAGGQLLEASSVVITL